MTDVVGLRFVTEGSEQVNRHMRDYRRSLDTTSVSMRGVDTAANRMRAQLLATANSVAILDGPLGGIASRFSALGVLIGRTGIILAGGLVGFAALGAVLNRGVRSMNEFEVQTARINTILQTTGHQAGLTGREVEMMASRIALSTLESESAVRSAAARLLTFGDVSGDVFERVLNAATDMAAMGFGTIESEAVKLAKALEDPAQALTSLSRAGIVFTRQQRQLIISLVESGQRAEAMGRILENVESRVGGAGEAAASGTMAGALDTLGQAAGRAARDFAGLILQITGVDIAIRAAADALEGYAGDVEGPAAEVLLNEAELVHLYQERAAALSELARLQKEADKATQRGMVAQANITLIMREGLQHQLTLLEAEIAARGGALGVARAEVRVTREQLEAQQALTQMARDTEGIDNLRMELDMRAQVIGLTDEQARVQRMLAQEGLLNVDIQQRINDLEAARLTLMRQGMDAATVNVMLAEYRAELESILTLQRDLLEAAERTRDFQADASAQASIAQDNALLTAQLELMRQGLTASEARVQAEYDLAAARLIQRSLNTSLTDSEREQARLALDQLATRYQLTAAISQQEQAQDALNAGLSVAQTLALNVVGLFRDTADAYQRAQDIGAARLSDIEREIELASVVLAFGVNSAEAEEVRRQHAAATVEEFIRQNGLAPQIADAIRRAAAEAFNLQSELRMATNEADALAAALARAAGVSAGLQNSVVGLRAQLQSAREGADQYTQARVRQLAVEREGLMVESGTLRQRGEALARLAEINGLLQEQESLQRDIASTNAAARSSGGGGGGGGASEQELATLEQIVAEMDTRIKQERELLGLFGLARRERELQIELQQRLTAEGVAYTEESIVQAAQVLAAEEQINETLRQRQETAEALANDLSQAFGKFFDSGFRDFKGFADNILKSFGDMLVRMVTEAAKQRIMFSMGIGPAPAGGGLLSSILGGAGGVAGGKGGILGGIAGGVAGGKGGILGGIAGLGGAIGALAGPVGIAIGLFSIFRRRQQQRNEQDKESSRASDERYRLETRLLELQGRTRELREREIALLQPANQELGRLIQRLELRAVREAEAAGLQTQLLTLQGRTSALRRRELLALHPANRALQRMIWRLEDAARVAEQRRELETRLLEVQGRTAALRRRELNALDPANRALQRMIWRLEDAARVAEERAGLETQILTLQGRTKELRQQELRTLDPTNRALQRLIWQLERAAAVADERTGLENRLLELQGNVAELRRRELEALYPANRALQLQIWALEDLRRALDALDMNDFITLVDYNRAVARGAMGLDPLSAPLSATPDVTSSIPQTTSPITIDNSDVRQAVDNLTSIVQQLLTRVDNNTKRSSNILLTWDEDGLPQERA